MPSGFIITIQVAPQGGMSSIENQEIFWPAVMCAIVNTGFTGYVAHEFVPTREPLVALTEAFAVCNV
jgi:hydroxypyruvate isomerase